MVDCSAVVESINIEVVMNSVRLRHWVRRMCQSPKEKEGRITKGSRALSESRTESRVGRS